MSTRRPDWTSRTGAARSIGRRGGAWCWRVTDLWALQDDVANERGLPEPQHRESDDEAKHGCGYHHDQVNSPPAATSPHNVEVTGPAFVSKYAKAHGGLHLHRAGIWRKSGHTRPPVCLRKIPSSPSAWGRIDGHEKKVNASPGARRRTTCPARNGPPMTQRSRWMRSSAPGDTPPTTRPRPTHQRPALTARAARASKEDHPTIASSVA
jgi:hypothetical protein